MEAYHCAHPPCLINHVLVTSGAVTLYGTQVGNKQDG
jgi:hypothetical protein